MHEQTRRQFIGTTAAATAALLTGATGALAATRKKLPIGVQLYSVRSVFAGDVPGTLAGIKKIGYEGVEFAGYATFGNDAKGLKKLLDDNGLKCCGTHTALQTLTGDALIKTVEYNQILGNPLLVVPSLRAATLADWAKHAETFSGIAEKLKPHQMRVGFHNHAVEFQPLEGQIPEDHFFGKASPDVFVQLDIGHCVRAGADPVAYLKKFAGRVLSVHAKDYVPDSRADIVGEGTVKWPAVLDACASVAGTQWYIVEEESNIYQGLEGIEKSFQGLTKLLA